MLIHLPFPVAVKKAGKVLLQTAPDGVDLVKLERKLKTCSPHILDVQDLHVWSLTPRSNRVATCRIVLDRIQVRGGAQVARIVNEAKFKFLDQNIRCTTIEPVFNSCEKPTSSSSNCKDSAAFSAKVQTAHL